MTPQGIDSPRIRAAEMLTLLGRAVRGHYRATEGITATDCVVALSFGYRLAGTGIRAPGPCNEHLASSTLTASGGRPIIAQAEIDQAIRSLREGMGADHVIGSPRYPRRYLDTREFAVQARAIMSDHGWRSAALIAHPHHLPRARAVFAALGIGTATPGGLRAVWDRESSQRWTRGPVPWAVREVGALWWYQRHGWLSSLR